MGKSIRTLICGLVAPGLGYWIVDKRRYGIATFLLAVVVVLVFSWTRFLLDPAGFRVALVCLIAILVGTALHAAFIESRGVEGDRKWGAAFLFAVIAGVSALLLFSFRGALLGYEAFRLPGGSMAPTLERGDRVVVDTWLYEATEPTSGDIVVFVAPGTGVSYVKRIVGIPGDAISLTGNQLTRNGEIVDEPYAAYEGTGEAIQPFPEIVVPPGQYLVLGDNRNRTKDSRHFGMVPRENLIGKVAVAF